MRKAAVGIFIGILGLAARAWGATGTADVRGTAPNSPIHGTVALQDTAGGLQITAQLSHLPPGPHAFHIHEFGDCGDRGKAAGDHYNPTHAPHGEVLKAGVAHAHAGDLGNLVAAADGQASLEAVIPGVRLAEGRYTVAGRAFIVHEDADQFTQPAGNAGGRIACGPILITAPAAAPAPPAK